MRDLALKVAAAVRSIEDERGPFKVKCLVCQDPEDIHWDLILWADWFEADEPRRLNYLIEKIINPMGYNLLSQFNAIITFGPQDHNKSFLRSLAIIQDNAAKGLYPPGWEDDVIAVHTSMPQARIVVPLNQLVRQEEATEPLIEQFSIKLE